MDKTELKEKLLATECFNDNEWLDKYVELVIANRNTEYIKYKTQSHHIIPRHCYNYLNLVADNSKFNLVNLYRCDHLLAHYYLAMMAKIDIIYAYNILSIKFTACTYQQDKVDEEWLLNNLTSIQEDYEKAALIVALKLKESASDRKFMNKDGIIKIIKVDEVQDYLESGWVLGGLSYGAPWNAGLTKADDPRIAKLGHNQSGSNNGNYNKFKYTNGIDFIRCKKGEQPEGYYRVTKEYNHHKKVICLETNCIYKGINQASRMTGISKDHISKMCKNKLGDKLNNKLSLHFKYVE